MSQPLYGPPPELVRIQQLERELREAEHTIDRADAHTAMMMERLEAADARVEQLEAANATLREERDRLTGLLAQETGECREAQAAAGRLFDERNAFDTRLKAAEARLAALTEAIIGTWRVIVEMRATIAASNEYDESRPVNRAVVLDTISGWAERLSTLREGALSDEQQKSLPPVSTDTPSAPTGDRS